MTEDLTIVYLTPELKALHRRLLGIDLRWLSDEFNDGWESDNRRYTLESLEEMAVNYQANWAKQNPDWEPTLLCPYCLELDCDVEDEDECEIE